MAITAPVETPFGPQDAYWRILSVTANNHGMPNSALARAYPSREYFYAADAVKALPDSLTEEARADALKAIEAEHGVIPNLPEGQNAFVAEREFDFDGDADGNGWPAAYAALAEELGVKGKEV